ncbi:MAPEG family protein [Pontivivens nitratireducens]|uniref:Glutathione S-transferase n=1 Tax=Pontivivens nitratireducens TaxID=2758038 RepID=A0A6G7VMV6_9RHOB|nr:MAPEG family protein [Pontibrevibacter nitratireducens]QIK41379.1 glutathione S-transferase [Pontibrevibacter nitratireducens]
MTDNALNAVALYAAFNTFILLWLAVNVGKKRSEGKISIGDGGYMPLIRAQRGQSNFVEYVPMALIMLTIMALQGAPVVAVHIAGIVLTLGRLIHAMHFISEDAPGWQRMYGTLATLAVLVLSALGLIGHALF